MKLASSLAGQIQNVRQTVFRFGLFTVLVCSAAGAAGQNYAVRKGAAPPPSELAAGVRDVLQQEVLTVSGPAGTVCEIWLRKSVPSAAAPSQELGITFGQIAEGTLVGAVRFPAAVQDYRRQSIRPGVYTLRYSLAPVDGNHQGVAPQRDYLLAIPASTDSSAAQVSADQTITLSKKSAGSHPSPWSLGPPIDDGSGLPKVVHQQEGDLWFLEFSVPVGSGASPSAVPMALVVVGHAPES